MIKSDSLSRMKPLRLVLPKASAPFWALAFLLVACFAFGGSARGDVASLVILRPLAALMLGFGLWHLQSGQAKAHRFVLAMAIAIVALPALQLIPLPPDIWHRLPGRGLVMEIDKVAGIGDIWRPLSLTPAATWNAFYATVMPIAVLVLGIQLDAGERQRLLVLAVFLGGFSALLGLFQTLGDPNGPLYFYSNTNNGSAVGLFANRNHQALLLAMMLPMLAILARGSGGGRNAPQLAAIVAGLVLLPLILITGSRSGLVITVLALLAIPLILGRRQRESSKRRTFLPQVAKLGLIATGAALVALTIWLGRDLAWDRLLAFSSDAESRARILPTLFSMIMDYAPTGSGMGSFERVYQVHEPDALLNPTYMNHAHNDWLEILLNGGVIAALLLFAGLIGFAQQVRHTFFAQAPSTSAKQMSRLGLLLALLAALASVFDYPLRVPSLAAFFALAVVWAGCSLPKKPPLTPAE